MVYARAREIDPELPPRVEVIDCTLRDGEQAPGVAFSVREKVDLAQDLVRAGISVLDAGFPASSGSDREAMQAIRDLNLNVRVAATARPLSSDVAAAATARASEVFMFMATSDLRLSQTLGLSRQDAELRLRGGVEEALGHGLGVSLVFEDATRADPEWLASLSYALTKSFPIARIVLADSVGCSSPARMKRLFQTLVERLDPSLTLCAHCHNDFGLATANTLAAVEAGARAVTCTVNGIGERAGNADLAETIAALTHLYGIEHGVAPEQLVALSKKVELMSGIHMSGLKPVTGFNVFRHESGTHVDAMMKDPRSYEFLPSQWVGREREYVVGKHSGLSVIRKLLVSAGHPASDDVARRLLAEAKRMAETRDKAGHEAAYKEHIDTLARVLSGIDAAELLRRAALDESPTSSVRPVPPAEMADGTRTAQLAEPTSSAGTGTWAHLTT